MAEKRPRSGEIETSRKKISRVAGCTKETSPCKTFPRVVEVRAYVKKSSRDKGAGYHDAVEQHWISGYPNPLASPMSGYPQYRQVWSSWGISALGSMIVEVECEDGSVGVGVSTGNGGVPGCYIVEHHLSRFVEGQDPRDVELIWDQMYRSTLHYGRKGLALQAMSAVDLALWDVLGKLRGEPVYALLGGKTKEKLPVYCTTSRPDIAKLLGFAGAKISCPYGPVDGDRGLHENVKMFREARESVGDNFPLMLDCYMALTVPYAIKLAQDLEHFKLKWIEECLHPDDYSGYADLRRSLRGICLVTTGEHEYTRYGYRQLLESSCADILQPDITWMGGITEARRVVALASAYDVPVIPHASSVYAYHLAYAFTNCPMAEYIIMSPKADVIVPFFGGLFPDEPLPKDGFIDLPDRPGFGVTLDKTDLERPYSRPAEAVKQQCEANRVGKCDIMQNNNNV